MQVVEFLLSPFGIDLFCFRKKFLVFNLVSRNLKIKYRRSIFGIFWTLLAPLSTTVVYYFVFQVILKVQSPYYLVMIIGCVMPWTFFSQSLSESMTVLVDQQSLISKIAIPTQVFPFVILTTNTVTLIFTIPIVLAVYFFHGLPAKFELLLLIFFYICLFLVTYGLSVLASFAFVYFRDLKHLLSIFLQICFYATPILYNHTMIPEGYQWLIYANPVASIVTGIQQILIEDQLPTWSIFLSSGIWALSFFMMAGFSVLNLRRSVVENL